jgi:hypothetical protein
MLLATQYLTFKIYISLLDRSKINMTMDQDTRVSIVTGYGLGRFNSSGKKDISFISTSRPYLDHRQPPIQWVPRALFMWVKLPDHEADRSPLLAPRCSERGIILYPCIYIVTDLMVLQI